MTEDCGTTPGNMDEAFEGFKDAMYNSQLCGLASLCPEVWTAAFYGGVLVGLNGGMRLAGEDPLGALTVARHCGEVLLANGFVNKEGDAA